MPNPNEECRKASERYDELMDIVRNLHYPKSYRQPALTEARKLERELGIEGESYNG